MDLRGLRIFLAVFDARSISAAAEQLGMNQPAVSKTIQRLERDLDLTLFDREPRGVVPTVFAEMLAETAREIDGNLRAVLRRIDATRNATTGEIAVGAGGTWQEIYLPAALSRLLARRPNVRVRIIPGPPEHLVAEMLLGNIDFALAPIDIPEAFTARVRTETLLSSDLAVVARRDHPAHGLIDPGLEDLAGHGWALPLGNVVRRRFDQLFIDAGLTPPVPALEIADTQGLYDVLANTDLLSFVSVLRLDLAGRETILPVHGRGLTVRRDSGLIRRRSSYLPPLARELIEDVRKVAAAQAVRLP
ncbi:LysR family transcriptional regulator [Sulfitobacter sp. D35]|uniref:LysR family transcriptional regulator n=1 Tax=Sulfitobacter sp. D35 TaxID=3083252 RepID=UPI00296E54D0|nr:LysR family transcriptional regulator [Sulfitobacter sp. D35]MDW4499337.1 LysR family transcriptional regulator [Sulfitobacter sp. D35]